MAGRVSLSLWGLLLTFLLCAGGCRLWNEMWFGHNPYVVEGTWTGTLVPITVFDREGRAYPAVAVRVSEPYRYYSASILNDSNAHDGGKLPVLGRKEADLERLVDPQELPLGRRVRLSGWMLVGYVHVDHRTSQRLNIGDVAVSRQSPYPLPEAPQELMLILRRGPEILHE